MIFGVSRAARRLRNAARVRFPSEIKQAVEACRDVRGGMRNADCCRLWVRVEPPFNAREHFARRFRAEIAARLIKQQKIGFLRKRLIKQCLGRRAEIRLHLGADRRDSSANLRKFASVCPRNAENADVIRVGKGAVAGYEGEKRRFSAAVRSAEKPALARPDGP